MSLLPMHTLLNILFDKDQAELLLSFRNVFYEELPCPKCGDMMLRNAEKKVFRCRKRSCEVMMNQRKHIFFSESRLNCGQILHMAYMWLNRSTQTQIKRTVTAFLQHFRNLVTSTLDMSDQMVGGEDVIVEIDETKLGKRKFNRGHRVDGVWVVVGVEKTPQRRIFLVEVEDRTRNTLLNIIQRHVLPGSVIHTDMFRSYIGIESELGFIHRTVNHSQNFRNPATGVHTNTVEGNNNALKIMIKPRNRVRGMEDSLGEFIWRRKNSSRLWEAFIDAVRDIHYDV
jgi:transposase-like protein